MSREIKFRAWVKQSWDSGSQKWVKNKMLYNAYPYLYTKVCLPDSGIGFANEGEFELMQFTNLKDKNDKEIYFEDVVMHNENNYVIRYSDNLGMIALATTKEYATFDGIVKRNHRYRDQEWLWRVQKYLTVIGNIFENPELLKNEK